jgi:hypothetical protein
VFEVTIPDDVDFDDYELIEEGKGYREWCVPSELLNQSVKKSGLRVREKMVNGDLFLDAKKWSTRDLFLDPLALVHARERRAELIECRILNSLRLHLRPPGTLRFFKQFAHTYGCPNVTEAESSN